MSNAVRRGELYPAGEGVKLPAGSDPALTRFRWTGEHRPAKAGEWFLSGAVVEAYRCLHDATYPRHIAVPVVGRVVWDSVVNDGYVCKRCGGPSPVGIGYVDNSAGAYERSAAVTVCGCGWSGEPE